MTGRENKGKVKNRKEFTDLESQRIIKQVGRKLAIGIYSYLAEIGMLLFENR